ncbi:Piwi-domain-containing protein [Stereum hirsutum FP-91666 SS1]|uniref:Piwi-domain-containing protein n=1 Tax=Stereum hirsutum (strain FP-91666) TaxID=721885 RepID=UPI000440BBEE|nr:Piwi-domain-containing protein [Stereum hirsutum FP-91666 SS1]EIM90203.1 Piwi-domain-containing protein [Stereum hirsutum FP-91666 SS1]
MSTAVVYRNINIIDFAMQYLGFRDVGQLVMMHPGSKEWKLLKSVLKGVRVITTVPPTDRQKAPRPIKDLIPQAGLYEFKIGNESWTVQQHYQKAHGYSMRFPKGWGIGFAGDAVVPPEVCVIIPGQLYRKKVPPANMKTVLDFSAKNPSDRLQIIEQGVNGSFLNYHQSDSLGLAGIKVGTSAMEIKGRMLDAPQVVYANGVLANTVGKSGAGNWNVLRHQFFSPGRLVKWVVVNLAGAPQEAANFAVELLKACRALGIECQPAGAVLDGNPSNAWATLESTKKHLADPNNPKSPPLLVAVVLPDSAAELRRLVKLWGDSANGVPTQCVRRMKLRPINNQYINNVALKVNAKLGGVNSIARGPVSNLINQTPTMIIGADVSHPGPGVQRPSIASVVASYDPFLSKYSTFVTLQMPRREVIENLKSMIKRSFEVFGSRTGRMPAIVFYYRDGVSDGEYADVLGVEGKAIEEAYTEVAQQAGQTSTMKLIFITVGKRHHFRFFPTQHGSRDGSGNVPSGLVVDQDIAHPRETDFYLQSQCGLKGTSRSSHYVVLRNDASVPMDDLQELSYMLCYNYARATKAVSIPAPVYYADLACERAGFYFDENLNFASEAGDSDGSTFDLNMWINGFKGIHRAMNTKLFFV